MRGVPSDGRWIFAQLLAILGVVKYGHAWLAWLSRRLPAQSTQSTQKSDAMSGSVAGFGASSGAGLTEQVVASLVKVQSVPDTAMRHGVALQGLANIGQGQPASPETFKSKFNLVELEGLLRDTGGALLERAGLLHGQPEREGVCAALQFLSFRCFCAIEVLHQAAGGVGADAVPTADALWGSICDAWSSVRSNVNLEGALADLTRWWQGRKAQTQVPTSSPPNPSPTAEGLHAVEESLSSIRKQASWLRGAPAGRLRSQAAAGHLSTIAEAAQQLRTHLAAAVAIGDSKLVPVQGFDAPSQVHTFRGPDGCVSSASGRLIVNHETQVSDVSAWSAELAEGASLMAKSVAIVLEAERRRIAGGLPRLVQAVHMVALRHGNIGAEPEDPLGSVSEVSLQLHCEGCWPLSLFVEDEAWGDIGESVRQRLCVAVLGVCAVAEACNVSLASVTVDSFAVMGVDACTVEGLASSLETNGCQVLLGACSSAWVSDKGSKPGPSLARLIETLLCPTSSASSVVYGAPSAAGAAELGMLAESLEFVREGGPSSCMAAYAAACMAMNESTGCLVTLDQEAERESVALKRHVQSLTRSSAVPPPPGPPSHPEESTLPAASAAGGDAEVSDDEPLPDQRVVQQGGDEVLRWAAGRRIEATVGHLYQRASSRFAQVASASDAVFICACESGHLDVVRSLLACQGARAINVHAADAQGSEAAFRLACANGQDPVVRELLALHGEFSVNVHARHEFGFRMACKNGHVKVVRMLLALRGHRQVKVSDKGAHIPTLGFREACSNGHVGVVQELLTLGGDRAVDVQAEEEHCFRLACAKGHTGVVKVLLGLSGWRTVDVHAKEEHAFRAACEYGQVEVVKELLLLSGSRTINVHVDREHAFRSACERGHAEVVRVLLGLEGKRQVDVHANDAVGPDAGYRLARKNNHSEVVELLEQLSGERTVPLMLRAAL